MPTVKFYLSRPRKNGELRTDEVTVYAMFSVDAENRFAIYPDEKVIPKYWDFRSQSVKTSHRHHIDINNYLSDFKRDLLNLWRNNRAQLTFEEFKTLAQNQGNTSQKKTLFDALQKFLTQYQNEKDKKTFQKYDQLRKILEAFDKQKPIDFPTMDLNFYDNFKAFLYSQPNQQYKKFCLVRDGESYSIQEGKGMFVPLLDNTVFKLISNLKNFLGWAEERGHAVHPAYRKWGIKTNTQKPISLTINELEKLENAILPEHLAIARDYLVFECRTGQRISDIKRFNLSQFANNTWTFNRKKGNRVQAKQVHVHFEGYCAPALKILERYNFKMPEISDQKLNTNIKEACKAAGIHSAVVEYHYSGAKCIKIMGFKYEFCTTHTGRRTFITLALQYMSPKIVKDLAGISDYKTLKHYEGDSEAGIIHSSLNRMSEGIKNEEWKRNHG